VGGYPLMSVVARALGSGQTLPLLTRLLSSARADHRSENTELLSVMETVSTICPERPYGWLTGAGIGAGCGAIGLSRWSRCTWIGGRAGRGFTKQGFQLEGVQARRKKRGNHPIFPFYSLLARLAAALPVRTTRLLPL